MIQGLGLLTVCIFTFTWVFITIKNSVSSGHSDGLGGLSVLGHCQ